MSSTAYLTNRELELLQLAQRGDQRAYGELVEPHRSVLHAHCYRMLGSLEDADDALQDALIRAWRGIGRFEVRSSLRTWLYRIATNSSLQLIERRPSRKLSPDVAEPAVAHTPPGEPLAESVWLEPYLDDPFTQIEQRETLELAFVASLQHLPPRQRAVLLLCEVLDFSAKEVAELFETTVASVNSALQRARQTVEQRVPAQTQQETLRTLGDEHARELVKRYMTAIEQSDVDGLVSLLTEDVVWAMPPLSTWYAGLDTVVPFLTEYPLTERWRHIPTRANAQLAVACYMWDEETQRFEGHTIDVLTLRGDRIAEVTAFIDLRPFARLGLPEWLDEE
ncbi:MAG TPA: sigma-70 family RNA polymerase sigma factor [Gaiellaceae bacterium]|nr:sigma-70 family RNA polymerase sigma factor [Gaiellaceae bacterium]